MNSAPSIEIEDRRDLVGRWFEAYQAPLYRYLLRLIADEQLAADILQDTFLRALAMLKKQVPPDNALAWLHRIATNLAYNALRRRNRWRWFSLSGIGQSTSFEGQVATAHTVRRCLTRLSRKEVEVLLLYEWAGLSCVEIAALTGIEVTAIRMRLSRARSRFRAFYEKEVADEML